MPFRNKEKKIFVSLNIGGASNVKKGIGEVRGKFRVDLVVKT